MKVLFVVTGRGIGGDAAIALNIAKALSEYGVECEFPLIMAQKDYYLKNMA